ncbi:MAG: PilW family protein, partial [Betaproteobacteria bacterium]
VQTGVAGMTNGVVYNLGQTVGAVGYAIRGGALTQCDFVTTACATAANWIPIANDIVGLRAQYGRDTTATAIDSVDQWTQIGSSAPPASPSACDLIKIRAIRLVLVARNPQFEKTDVTGVTGGAPAPTWVGDTVTTDNPVAALINLSADASWKQYRYKTFQAIVPIRNAVYAAGGSGC